MSWNEREWTPEPGEILTVTELLGRVRRMAEAGFGDVWVEGEVSNLRVPGSGHAYFTLLDAAAQLKAVCFRTTLRLLDLPPENGLKVLARGHLTIYEPRGDLQLVVEQLSAAGEGLLSLRFEALKRKLAEEGLFAAERKRPLPAMPRSVAVVTSPTGAAVRDILQVLGRRAPWVDVVVCPARVQGEGAAAELRRALAWAAEPGRADVVILGRGGGAAEDLSAFNDEALVRAVADCSVPVISAVGHEIDFTLCDFAADARAPTPSAAAEMAVREAGHWRALLSRADTALASRLAERLSIVRTRLLALDPRRFDPARRIERGRIRADRALERAREAGRRGLSAARERLASLDRSLSRHAPEAWAVRRRASLDRFDERMSQFIDRVLEGKRVRLALGDSALANLSPLAVLERGYAVVRDENGAVVRDAATRSPGDKVDIRLARGGLDCVVKEIR